MIPIYIFLFIALFVFSGIKVMREFERGVVLRLGRIKTHRGPGLIYVIPVLEKMIRVDMRASSSEGKRLQSAVMKSSVSTQRIAIA